MTGTAALPAATDWKAALERLVPSVAQLLHRATGQEPVRMSRPATRDITLTAPLTFPDGIGRGALVATLFAYRGAVRLDIVAELLGLSKSPPGMDGSQVLGLWRAGRVEEIEAYCLGDVRLVYEVFLRIEGFFR